jgi:hypothetical protein
MIGRIVHAVTNYTAEVTSGRYEGNKTSCRRWFSFR